MTINNILNEKELTELHGPVERVQEHAKFYTENLNYPHHSGLNISNELSLEEAASMLESIGGKDFQKKYLPFLYLMNGFSLNGVTLFGLKADASDLFDLRRAKSALNAAPELSPVEFDRWVWVGETSLDVLIYNIDTGLFEQRDRVALDSSYEEPATLSGLISYMADLLDTYKESIVT